MSHCEMPEPCLRLAHGTGEYASVQLGDGTGYVPIRDYRELERENERLRKELGRLEGLYVAKKAENDKLRRKLGILGEHGVEIVDAVAGGFEIYSEDYRRADSLEAQNANLRTKLADAEERCTRLQGLLAIASDMALDYDGDRRLLRRLLQELYEDQCDDGDKWKYRDRMRELGVELSECSE